MLFFLPQVEKEEAEEEEEEEMSDRLTVSLSWLAVAITTLMLSSLLFSNDSPLL